MPSNPPVPNARPVVLGMRFDAVTVPQALDRFFELAAMPPGPRGCRIAATVNVEGNAASSLSFCFLPIARLMLSASLPESPHICCRNLIVSSW